MSLNRETHQFHLTDVLPMVDGNEAQRVKDFDRLYERLVARKRPAAKPKGTKKKKLKKLRKPSAVEEPAPKKPQQQPNDAKLPRVQDPVAVGRTDSDAFQKQPNAVPTSDVTHDGEERQSDLLAPQPAQKLPEVDTEPEPESERHIYDAVARLRLGRNFRAFARVYARRPRRLSAQITSASTLKTFQHFVNDYRDLRDHGTTRPELRHRGLHRHRMLGYVRLEQVAARLFRRRCNDFHPNKKPQSRVNGRHGLLEELCFFSPPHSGFQSLIGYIEATNAVALPPARVVRE